MDYASLEVSGLHVGNCGIKWSQNLMLLVKFKEIYVFL